MTVREFCKAYKNQEFNKSDFSTQVKAGWCDWFCDVSELAERLSKLWNVLKEIHCDFILDNFSLRFFNRCPINSPLYDEIMFICLDEKQNDIYNFNIAINCPDSNATYSIFTTRNDYNEEISYNNISDVIQWINNWETQGKNPKFYETKEKKSQELETLCDKTMELLKSVEKIIDN